MRLDIREAEVFFGDGVGEAFDVPCVMFPERRVLAVEEPGPDGQVVRDGDGWLFRLEDDHVAGLWISRAGGSSPVEVARDSRGKMLGGGEGLKIESTKSSAS